MIQHLVYFKFKPEVTDAKIFALLDQLAALKKDMPSMLHYSRGVNCSIENLNKGFTHAMMMTFKNAAGRDEYINHSEHKRVAAEITLHLVNGLESAIVIDYEFEDDK